MQYTSRRSLIWVVCVLCIVQVTFGQQLLQSNVVTQVKTNSNASIANANSAAASAGATVKTNNNSGQAELRSFEEYRRSPIFVEPFDPKVISLPQMHLNFVRDITRKDIVLYKEILHEAIGNRNKVAPSVRLMLKYGGRLITNFIKNRREEKRLTQRVEPKSEFFIMLADMAQSVMDQSSQLKRNYSKNTIDVENFRLRVEALLDYVQTIIETSPMGAYMKWDQLVIFKDHPRNGVQNRRFIEELADLTALFRAMGYESTSFFIRRIINLLRLFARGVMPSSEKEV